MRRFLALLFLLSGLLAAATDSEILQRADQHLNSSSKTEIFRAYDEYKMLYLKAKVENDVALCYQCLEGIVVAGEKLRIDVSDYADKLKQLKNDASVEQKNAAIKLKPKATKKKDEIRITDRLKLESVRWTDGKLVMAFDAPLSPDQIDATKLLNKKKGRYRYIFDIEAIQTQKHTLRHQEIKRIKLAQYDSKTLRLVIENDTMLNVQHQIDKELLIIDLGVASVTAPLANRPLRAKERIIVLDPGHGGKDGGAVGYKRYLEKNVVLQISNRLARMLTDAGYTVHMTRSNDIFIELHKRTQYANKKNADLFVSIHANAVPKRNAKKAYGIETYFLSPARSERAKNAAAKENSYDSRDMEQFGQQYLSIMSREKIYASHKLAIDLQRSALARLRQHYSKVKDGGARSGPFWVLVGAKMPAVLVEVGFISHPMEARRLIDKKYQQYFAEGLAEGIERYFANNP
jgi:N-acetylmuramoyl-L-alanine amidase